MAADFSWTPPLVILALGSVAGAVLVARGRRPSAKAPDGPAKDSAHTADLRREYDALIRRLAEGGTAEERASVELEAAKILRKMETGAPAPRSEAAESTPRQTQSAEAPRPTSALAGFLYGALTVAALGSLVFFASQGATQRPEGGSPTGGDTMGSASSAEPGGPSDAEIAALEAAVQKAPGDIGLRIELTRAYVQRRDLMKVFDVTKAVLEIEPGNPQALTYQGLVRVAMGQADQAETMLVEAIRTDPGIEDAYIHLALARLQLGNRKGAEEAIQAGQRQFPEDKELLANVFAQITSQADGETGPGAPPVEHPEIGAAPAAGPASASSAPGMVVVVDLPRGVTVPEGSLLYVVVREAGFDSGAPIAVKRVPAANFPITVTISEMDSMAGESLPGLVRIDARIDSDGDPLSKDPLDPAASEDNVRPGGGQTLLVLTPGGK